MPDLVERRPYSARALEAINDGMVIRVHLAMNVEQGLDRIEVHERPGEAIVVPLVGWKADARPVHARSVAAGGTRATFVDVGLIEKLGEWLLRDGAATRPG
jgi:hypothetical protein